MPMACGPIWETQTHDHVVKGGGIDSGPADQRGEDLRRQVRRMDPGEAAAAPPDGRPYRPDDECLSHRDLRHLRASGLIRGYSRAARLHKDRFRRKPRR